AEPVAFIVADILADRTGRAITFGLDSPLSTRYWTAVKTGTSKDMRDNWCIGFSRRYTVGVWVGNFEGDAMHDVSGITGAAPVWQTIMDALHADAPADSTAPQAPEGVVSSRIEFRPALEPPRREWFLAGTEVRAVVLNDPARRRPRIVSPPNGVVIALDPDIPPGHQAVVVAVSSPPSGAVVELDGQPIGVAAKHPKWPPQPGRHRLTLVVAPGTVIDTVDFSVRRLPDSDGGEPGTDREPANGADGRR
ncbi:MAG: penicillin-binding protein 1C, partial [Gammaproteobacteria bacterium]|nr:penicillin-binding protein 1C [Gammaproteobacteria bacterium]